MVRGFVSLSLLPLLSLALALDLMDVEVNVFLRVSIDESLAVFVKAKGDGCVSYDCLVMHLMVL